MFQFAEYYELFACILVIGLALKTRALLPAVIALEFSLTYFIAYRLDHVLMADMPLLWAIKNVLILVLLTKVIESNRLIKLSYALAFFVSVTMYLAWLHYAATGSLTFGNVAFVLYQWGILASMIGQLIGAYNGRNNGKRVRRTSSVVRNSNLIGFTSGFSSLVARINGQRA